MYTVIAILIMIASILLVLVVLMQNPKGGGLSSTFGGGGNQIMGAKKTTDFLEKATWTLAITMIALILVSNFSIDRGTGPTKVIGSEKVDEEGQFQNFDFLDQTFVNDTIK